MNVKFSGNSISFSTFRFNINKFSVTNIRRNSLISDILNPILQFFVSKRSTACMKKTKSKFGFKKE